MKLLSRVPGSLRNCHHTLLEQEYGYLLVDLNILGSPGLSMVSFIEVIYSRGYFCLCDFPSGPRYWSCSCAFVLIVVLSSVVSHSRLGSPFQMPFFGSLSEFIVTYKSAHNWTLRIYFATWYRFKLASFRDAIL